jgi:hypothetical protein
MVDATGEAALVSTEAAVAVPDLYFQALIASQKMPLQVLRAVHTFMDTGDHLFQLPGSHQYANCCLALFP